MASAPPDPELVRRCLDGDAGAWSVLVGRYADLVHGLARRAGLGADVAADVVQEVSLALLRNLPRLRDRDRLLPWVLTTTRREAWRQARRLRAGGRLERAVARAEAAPGALPDEAIRAAEDEQAVREALLDLSESCRRLLRALYFDPEPRGYDEVAEGLGIPRGSIGPTRGRCLERLRRALVERGFGPEPDVSGETPAASPPGRRR